MKSSDTARRLCLALMLALTACKDGAINYTRAPGSQDQASADSARGQALFNRNCASCHGPGGEGRQQTGAPSIRHASIARVDWALANVAVMSGLSVRLSPQDRAHIVAFLGTEPGATAQGVLTRADIHSRKLLRGRVSGCMQACH